MTYEEARLTMAGWLERNARESPGRPDQGFEQMDAALPRGSGPEWAKLFVALHFWDGWIDASQHEWKYYEPIQESDWPDTACRIAVDLRQDRDISNPWVVERFGPRPKAPLSQ